MNAAPVPWQPYREPLRATLLRTVTIALIIGLVFARNSGVSGGGGLARWPAATLLALWPAFGGHWVELFFLNWLRPRVPAARTTQVAARLAVWFVGGAILWLGMSLTARTLSGFHPIRAHAWWFGGIAFIGIELIVHIALHFRGRPNFYNGRG